MTKTGEDKLDGFQRRLFWRVIGVLWPKKLQMMNYNAKKIKKFSLLQKETEDLLY